MGKALKAATLGSTPGQVVNDNMLSAKLLATRPIKINYPLFQGVVLFGEVLFRTSGPLR